MMSWFSGLVPRERLVVTGGALVLSALLCYFLVLAPLDAAIRQKESILQAQRSQMINLRALTAEYRSLGSAEPKKGSKSTRNTSLLAIVDASGAEQGIKDSIKRLSPEGKDKVRIHLEEAPFDNLVVWLAQLSADHRITAESTTVRRGDEPGKVSGNLLLQRKQ
jgi:general secretion pathway protein M